MFWNVRGMVSESVLFVTVLLCYSALPAASQNPLVHDLTYVLPLVISMTFIIIIFIVVIYVMYRAKRGYFCCIKPTPYRYPRHTAVEEHELDEHANEQSDQVGTQLPSYQQNNLPPPPMNIAPPDYRDALQDAIITSATPMPPQNQFIDTKGVGPTSDDEST